MELFPDPVATHALERILMVIGAIVFAYLGHRLFVIGVETVRGHRSADRSEAFRIVFSGRGPQLFFMAFGAMVLVAAIFSGCAKDDREEDTVKKGKVKGTVGTSIDLDVPIEEANREIRATTESTTEGTCRKAANAPLEGDEMDTLKLFEK